MLDVPTVLANVVLREIRVAKQGISRIKATMEVGKDLVEEFKLKDIFSRSAVSIVFDGGPAFRALTGKGLIRKD